MENNINPYMYFTYLFEQLPNINLEDKDLLRTLLPYSDQLPEYVKTLTKKEIKTILSDQA